MSLPFISIKNIVYREPGGKFQVPLHVNPEMQWFFCSHGTLIVNAGHEQFLLEPGDAILIPPNVERSDFGGRRPPGYVMALFEIAGIDISSLYFTRKKMGGALQKDMQMLVDELIRRKDAISEMLVEIILLRILIGSLRDHSVDSASPVNEPANAEIAAAIEAYLRDNLHRPIKRSEIAGVMRLSQSHVARIFLAATGLTLLERLTQLRIERAKELLTTSSMPVSDIAGKVGITSFSHFTRIFTKSTGMVPTDYRRRGGCWRSGSGRLGALRSVPSWCHPLAGNEQIEQGDGCSPIEPVGSLGTMMGMPQSSASPSSIAVAVLGLGGMGSTHVRAARESRFVSSVIGYEPDAEYAAKRSRELGIATTAKLDEIFSDPAVRLVCIAAPNSVHADLAIGAMKAGKSVLCEKPMGNTLEEARRILKAEKDNRVFLQIGFELRYSRMYRQVKEWIQSGLIGDVLNIQCRYYASEFHGRDTWRSLSSATLVGEKLSHYLDLMRWWMNADPIEVYAASAPNAVDYFHHPDNHQAIVRFPSDRIGVINFIMGLPSTFHGDVLQDLLEQQMDDGHFLQYHITGTKGAIETDVFRRRLRRWRYTMAPEKMLSSIVEVIGFGKDEDGEWFHNVHGQNLRVIELVAGNQSPEFPALDALSTMRLCFAIEESCRTHRIVSMVGDV